MKNKNDTILLRSASGGVFGGIASLILDTPGNAVFGCAFDDDVIARHMCITNFDDISPLQGSKYVQSDVGDSYKQTEKLLSEGATVFFTGTPCQIAGLFAYLGKDYNNLLTADLVCHGVPSPLLFKRYIAQLSKKLGGKIIYYGFREKGRNGWGLTIKVVTKSKTRSIVSRIDPYFNSFLHNLTLRESCYSCQYAGRKRVGDITLGDYWGIEKVHPDFHSPKGVSVVLINSRKGERLFMSALDKFEIVESSYEKAASGNINLREQSPRSVLRNNIYFGINDETKDIFKNPGFKIKTKTYVATYIKESLKRVLPPSVLQLYKRIRYSE